tara:strand:+ start:575 stop:1918 length:1344 start_codon:yes stop_codon:yes gene_type:complete
MAEKSYLQYIPPGALRDVARTGYQLLDNVIGFDDDYDTTGELLAGSLRENPVGTISNIASSVKDGVVAAYEDPRGTISAMGDEFVDAFTLLNTPLPEDATREQMGQHLEAASVLATVIPGYKGAQVGGRAAVGGVDNALQAQADRFYYPEGFIPAPDVAPGSRMIVPSQTEYGVLPSEVLADQFELPIRDMTGERLGSRIVTPMGEEAREMIRPYGDASLNVVDNPDIESPIQGQYLPNKDLIELRPGMDARERASVLQHEIAHFDQDQSRLPYEETGTDPITMAEVRDEQIAALDSLIKDSSIPKDERKSYRVLRKELNSLTPQEMYEANPGEMLARIAMGDPTSARKVSALQMLNPYIMGQSNPSYRDRIGASFRTGFRGDSYFDEVPMDLNQARVFDDIAYDTYDPIRPETSLELDRPAFSKGPRITQPAPQEILDDIYSQTGD